MFRSPATFHLAHVTRYDFERPVSGVRLRLRLRPPATANQSPGHVDVTTVPGPDSHRTVMLPDGRTEDIVVFEDPLDRIVVRAQSTVRHLGVGQRPPADRAPSPDAFRGIEPDTDAWDPLVWAWASEVLPDCSPSAEQIRRFAARLHRDFAFDPCATTRDTKTSTFFRRCRGVCEDFSRLALACLRAREVPARYVVGYLLPSPGLSHAHGRRAHAWISVWSEVDGWIDLDPTTGLAVPDHHLVSTWGADHLDTVPVSGRLAFGEDPVGQRLHVDVSISRASP